MSSKVVRVRKTSAENQRFYESVCRLVDDWMADMADDEDEADRLCSRMSVLGWVAGQAFIEWAAKKDATVADVAEDILCGRLGLEPLLKTLTPSQARDLAEIVMRDGLRKR